jgi:hypothetical protein
MSTRPSLKSAAGVSLALSNCPPLPLKLRKRKGLGWLNLKPGMAGFSADVGRGLRVERDGRSVALARSSLTVAPSLCEAPEL